MRFQIVVYLSTLIIIGRVPEGYSQLKCYTCYDCGASYELRDDDLQNCGAVETPSTEMSSSTTPITTSTTPSTTVTVTVTETVTETETTPATSTIPQTTTPETTVTTQSEPPVTETIPTTIPTVTESEPTPPVPSIETTLSETLLTTIETSPTDISTSPPELQTTAVTEETITTVPPATVEQTTVTTVSTVTTTIPPEPSVINDPARRRRSPRNIKQDGEYNCYVFHQKISNDSLIVQRGCVRIIVDKDTTCQLLNHGIQPEYCNICDSDRCNEASRYTISIFVLLSTLLTVCIMYIQQ